MFIFAILKIFILSNKLIKINKSASFKESTSVTLKKPSY